MKITQLVENHISIKSWCQLIFGFIVSLQNYPRSISISHNEYELLLITESED